ncbi:MAG TPA: hypothetical protein DD424_04245 [Porphyromonadaceae bacterium]|nr:hypothetical protein EEL39_08545 [Muribaculaceae bacterium Isolate-080 (Janvier)]HBN63101.1 hypothetical protein [Porphyromonadaceae bacterium]
MSTFNFQCKFLKNIFQNQALFYLEVINNLHIIEFQQIRIKHLKYLKFHFNNTIVYPYLIEIYQIIQSLISYR